MTTSHTISINEDHVEAGRFVAWLNDHGHTADTNNTNCEFLDGVNVTLSQDTDHADQRNASTRLWIDYCDDEAWNAAFDA